MTGLITRFLSRNTQESSKRLIAILAACTLCLCAYVLTMAIVWQALWRGTVDGNLCLAAGSCHAIVATLAGVAYRKREDQGATATAGTPDQGSQS